MAIIILVGLVFTAGPTICQEVTFYEYDFVNFTNNETYSDPTELTLLNYTTLNDTEEFDIPVQSELPGFWDAWEKENGSYLENISFYPTTPVTYETFDSESPVTQYFTNEDVVTRPAGDIRPVKLAAEVPGDLILGGLMMVHERGDTENCGPVMPQGGIQAVEIMLYTLDIINQRLGKFTLGAHILDDCDKDTYGLEMAVDFIKD